MKKLFFIFLILLFAIWIGFLISEDSGYVLISYSNWSVETSIWIMLILLVLIFTLTYFIIRAFKHTSRLNAHFQKWGKQRRGQKVRKLTHYGLCELAEGNWARAETLLNKAAKSSSTPLINYLSCAKAAQEQQAYDRRDNYLRKAHKSTKGAEVAIGLTQAELQISSKQWEQALATLTHLRKLAPNHKHTLKLLYNVYQELDDWEELKALLPILKKWRVLSSSKFEALEKTIYLALIEKNHNLWESIPKSLQTHPQIVQVYVKHLLIHHGDKRAASIIENTLKKNWDATLLRYYGLARGKNPASQLTCAETWLKSHPRDPDLLLCLGRLSINEKLWGKARQYLEQCLRILPTAQAHQELGHVLEELGEQSSALENYRKGLFLTESQALTQN